MDHESKGDQFWKKLSRPKKYRLESADGLPFQIGFLAATTFFIFSFLVLTSTADFQKTTRWLEDQQIVSSTSIKQYHFNRNLTIASNRFGAEQAQKLAERLSASKNSPEIRAEEIKSVNVIGIGRSSQKG